MESNSGGKLLPINQFLSVDETVRSVLPLASRGGSRGYPLDVRVEQIFNFYQRKPIRVSRSSIRRWEKRILPKEMDGGSEKKVLIGKDQFLLVLGLTIWPDLKLREIATFIYGEGGGLYSDQAISRHLKELSITRKKPSREAFQAFLPRNRLKAIIFWSYEPPLGVVGVPRRTLLDFDEFSVSLKRCNRTMAWGLKFERVRLPGHYNRTGSIFTVLLAIEPGDERLPDHLPGSVAQPGRWINVIRNQGTTSVIFASFVNTVLSSIENRNAALERDGHLVDCQRFLLWDNLASHGSIQVHNALTSHRGRLVAAAIPRPPYQPKYGPIEYKICDLIAQTRIHSRPDWDDVALEAAIYSAAERISGFNQTFAHCGYTIDGH